MTNIEKYERELSQWLTSAKRREMIDGYFYYIGQHDILKRRRMAIGKDGEMIEIKTLPNSRIIDNQYAKHVDQKTNYILGRPVSFVCENRVYAEAIRRILNKNFMKTLRSAVLESYNSGIAWLYPFYNNIGMLEFRLFSGHEILPFWLDSEHTQLSAALRLYTIKENDETIEKVNLFDKNGIKTFTLENGHLIADGNYESYIKIDDKPYNWTKIPLIPIKSNECEIPLIRRARSLQDAINLMVSNFSNNMQEDSRNTILVVKNYDGQDLGELRQNLATFGAIKVRTVEGVQGGVDSIEIEVNAENYKAILKMLKSALIENMRSFDGKDERLQNSPNQLNIKSLYADLDLDANTIETELQVAFEEILWYVNCFLYAKGAGDHFDKIVEVVCNRDILINETELIDNITKQVGLISRETLLSKHPWIIDIEKEMDRIRKQESDEFIQSQKLFRYMEKNNT